MSAVGGEDAAHRGCVQTKRGRHASDAGGGTLQARLAAGAARGTLILHFGGRVHRGKVFTVGASDGTVGDDGRKWNSDLRLYTSVFNTVLKVYLLIQNTQ